MSFYNLNYEKTQSYNFQNSLISEARFPLTNCISLQLHYKMLQ